MNDFCNILGFHGNDRCILGKQKRMKDLIFFNSLVKSNLSMVIPFSKFKSTGYSCESIFKSTKDNSYNIEVYRNGKYIKYVSKSFRDQNSPKMLENYEENCKNGHWNSWGSWTACSNSNCGKKGKKSMSRSCINPSQGTDCKGDSIKYAECIGPCPGEHF